MKLIMSLTQNCVNVLNEPSVLSNSVSTNMSLNCNENNSFIKRKKRKLFESFCLEEREKYKTLLNRHISHIYNFNNPHNNSFNSLQNKSKAPEIIDLTKCLSSSESKPSFMNGFSQKCSLSTDCGISKENLDNKTSTHLIQKIKNAGIVAKTFNGNNSIHSLSNGFYNKIFSSTPFNGQTRDSKPSTDSTRLTSQLPESSKRFKFESESKKGLFEHNWIQDLKDSLTLKDHKFISDVQDSERKVIESKAKRESHLEKSKRFISTPYTRSEISFIPFCHLEDKSLDYEEEQEVEEESIGKDMPQMTQEMEAMIDDALRPSPPNEILCEAFSITIRRKDMETLSGLNWLNDEVINFYMSLIVERSKNDNYNTSYAFNTFFYPRLREGGHKVLKRWTRRVDIFANDFIFIPIHLGMHWCLAVIDFINKKIEYYDSMGGKNNECVQALKCYLQEESIDKKKKEYDMSDWSLEIVKDIPQQMNGSDCGMFTCKYAEYISRRAKINFSQAHMPYFRRRMVYEILTSKLL